MSPPSIFIFFLLLSITRQSTTAAASHRHLISFPASIHHPSTLSWDPTAQHFVVGSSLHPTISSISDAGISDTIVSDPLLLPNSSISSLSIDSTRRRLLVSLRSPASLAAYDLSSPRPHPRIFLTSLPSSPSSIALDRSTGNIFITASNSAVIWKSDLNGAVSDLSRSAIFGLTAVTHASKGFLIAVQGKTGRVFKVDEDSGRAMEVIGRNGVPAPLDTEAAVVTADGSAVFVGGKAVRMVRSGDAWAEAAVRSEQKAVEGRRFAGVAVRDGNKVYALVVPPEEEGGGGGLGSRIEEVEWEEEGDMIWAMVLVGFGLAYFLYWRFQMGQLVSNMNKKRA